MAKMAYKKFRLFDGKRYTAEDVETSKQVASRLAEGYRNKGWNARVIISQDKKYFTGKYYTVWIRK